MTLFAQKHHNCPSCSCTDPVAAGQTADPVTNAGSQQVRVKPLVWEDRGYEWSWWSGEYQIRCEGGIGYLVDFQNVTIADPFDTLEAAKAAAQADYEARILSAIDTTAPPDPRDEVIARQQYRLEWLAGARPPMHPEPMRGAATFDTFESAVSFFLGRASDAVFLSLAESSITEKDVSVMAGEAIAAANAVMK